MERRKLELRDFAELAAEVDRLKRVGCTKVGNWDLGQACYHLGLTMQQSLDGFTTRAPWLLRVTLAPIFKRRLLKTRVMPAGIKGPPVMMPPDRVDETTVLKHFDEQLARVRDHAGEFEKHPFFGYLTNEEWKLLHLMHASLHLSFLVPREGS
jgi:hypothetical protein